MIYEKYHFLALSNFIYVITTAREWLDFDRNFRPSHGSIIFLLQEFSSQTIIYDNHRIYYNNYIGQNIFWCTDVVLFYQTIYYYYYIPSIYNISIWHNIGMFVSLQKIILCSTSFFTCVHCRRINNYQTIKFLALSRDTCKHFLD